MRKGKKVKNAILKANKKYPNEALKFDRSNIGDIADRGCIINCVTGYLVI
jgi:hypothetical protein